MQICGSHTSVALAPVGVAYGRRSRVAQALGRLVPVLVVPVRYAGLGPLRLRHSKYVENELSTPVPHLWFPCMDSLELVLFTFSCCVAVLDSKVVSIGWDTGLGRCVQPSPGRVQNQGPGDR